MRITIDTSNCPICESIVKDIIDADTDEDKYWEAEVLTDHWNQQASIIHQIVKQVSPSLMPMCQTPNCPNRTISHSRCCMNCIRTGYNKGVVY